MVGVKLPTSTGSRLIDEQPQPPFRWRLVGVLSGIGPGLLLAGIARLAGELAAARIGIAATAVAVGAIVFLISVLALVQVIVLRDGRPGGPTRRNDPAIAAFALTALAGAAFLPDAVSAIVMVAIGALVRLGVAVTAGLLSRRLTPDDGAHRP